MKQANSQKYRPANNNGGQSVSQPVSDYVTLSQSHVKTVLGHQDSILNAWMLTSIF